MDMSKYRVVGGTSYHKTTPDSVIRILEQARNANVRLKITYGDTLTGKAWADDPEEGYIGRSMGTVKIPLLVHNSRSSGGPGLLDHCIVKIEPTRKIVPGFRWTHHRFREANEGRRLRLLPFDQLVESF